MLGVCVLDQVVIKCGSRKKPGTQGHAHRVVPIFGGYSQKVDMWLPKTMGLGEVSVQQRGVGHLLGGDKIFQNNYDGGCIALSVVSELWKLTL